MRPLPSAPPPGDRPPPPRTPSRLVVWLSGLLVGAGCGGGTEDGVALGELPVLEPVERERIERVDAEPLPAGLLDARFDRAGRLHLLERDPTRLRVVGRDGAELARVSWTSPDAGAVRLAPDGTALGAWDPGAGRFFRMEGGEIAEEEGPTAFEPAEDALEFGIRRRLPDGSWLAAPSRPPRVGIERGGFRVPHVRVGGDGEAVDTLWTDEYADRHWFLDFGGERDFTIPNPFDPSPLRAFPPGDPAGPLRLVTVRHELSPGPRIVVERARLAPVEPGEAGGGAEAGAEPTSRADVLARIPFEPDPIGAEEVDRAVQLQVERLTAEGVPRPPTELRATARELLRVPEVRRPVQQVLVGDDGTLWLRAAPRTDEGGFTAPPGRSGTRAGPGSSWTILAPDGEPRARASLPAGFVPSQLVGGCAVGVDRSEASAPRILVLELTFPDEPAGGCPREWQGRE